MAQTNVYQYNSWRTYFTIQNNSATCNICNAITSRHFAPSHLYKSHDITDQEVILRWNNDNHLIFQHFSKEDLFSAKCKFCGKLLQSAYDKRSLDAHLRLIHKQEIVAMREEITRTWVSSHYTFDYKCKVNCMYCNYSGKIYDGVGVLKNHLKEAHNLEKHFVCRIEKELKYLETTMQCTTEESNVATSFQDGNTH